MNAVTAVTAAFRHVAQTSELADCVAYQPDLSKGADTGAVKARTQATDPPVRVSGARNVHNDGESDDELAARFIAKIPLAGLSLRVQQYASHNIDADDPGAPEARRQRLRAAAARLQQLQLTVDSRRENGEGGCGDDDEADMAALKALLSLAPQLETLALRGDIELPPGDERGDDDGDAGAGGNDSDSDSDSDNSSFRRPPRAFYLRPFRFGPTLVDAADGTVLAVDRLPALRHLHLWRYDWRQHAAADVAEHWDLRRLQTLALDGAPLRRVLGALDFAQLGGLEALRLDDAEWALQPGHSRQAAQLVGALLLYHVRRLRRLELVRCFTDNLPLAALQRHAGSLEVLVLRHPFGLGAAGADAATPTPAPLLLQVLLQGGRRAETETETRTETEKEKENETEEHSDMLPEPAAAAMAPGFSRLHTLELDLDDRHLQGPDEAELLSRLARLPRLAVLTLAVPSVLRSLRCVPKLDVDVHRCLQRLTYLLGQKQQVLAERQKQQKQQQRCDPEQPLDRVAFHIGGWSPIRGAAVDEDSPPLTQSQPPKQTPGTHVRPARSFLAPSLDLDLTPGIGPVLARRGLGLPIQRCITAEKQDCQDDQSSSSKLRYQLYEEFNELEAVPEGSGRKRRRVRVALPYVIDFARPDQMAAPTWDVEGLAMWA